jgi:hypothetical protein
MATAITRIVCATLFFALSTASAYLFFQKDNRLGLKLLWVAAIILGIAIQPERLPFFSGNASSLLFFRNAFALVSVCLLIVDVFVVFWIQLPLERIPRFQGVVSGYVHAGIGTLSKQLPQVEFNDEHGQKRVIADRFAGVLFPGRVFRPGERVSVIVPSLENAHIDYSVLSRWDVAIFLLCLTALTLTFSIACHIRYLQMVSGGMKLS